MSKDARKQVQLTAEAKREFDACIAAMAACGFGEDGPPRNTTFAQIEDFGLQVGRMLAQGIEQRLTEQHAAHFQEEECPTCGTSCPVQQTPAEREIQTCGGPVPLREPVCHCSVCRRDFFPSADGAGD